jgi:glycosyltransferase involved in cell wall biosynthesis
VSVVINNYNYRQYLEIAIASVFSQTYTNCELIVVDDGSTDGSEEILQRYETQAKIVRKQHGGETSGRNEGFRNATGEIIAFLDADDYWKPDAIEKVVRAWDPGFGKLQFPLQIVDRNGDPTGGRMPRMPLSEGRVDSLLLDTGRYITCPTSGNFYSRRFLESIFPVPVEEWPQSMDSYAATYAGFYGPIGAIHEELGCYRVHTGNMTNISGDGYIHSQQIERLMSRGLRLRSLIEKIARERDLNYSPEIVTGHWLYLKLEIARRALLQDASLPSLWPVALKLFRSVLTDSDLTFFHRIEWLGWTIALLLLPRRLKVALVRVSFDLASTNPLARAVRLT